MGIHKTYKTEDEFCFAAIWKITEDEEQLFVLAKLSEEENLQYCSIKAKARKKEWLAVRALLNNMFNTKVEIGYEESGRPFLKNSPYCLSISHSSDFAAVSINTEPSGIDIQTFKPSIINLKNRFLSNQEKESFDHDCLEWVSLYWCAKEALFKACGLNELIFKDNISIEAFPFSQTGLITGAVEKGETIKKYLLNYYLEPEFALVFTRKQIQIDYL
jgi:4'-phosphopantetheinyl transferase